MRAYPRATDSSSHNREQSARKVHASARPDTQNASGTRRRGAGARRSARGRGKGRADVRYSLDDIGTQRQSDEEAEVEAIRNVALLVRGSKASN